MPIKRWDGTGRERWNLNIRYGQMTMALLAQTVLHSCAADWANLFHLGRGSFCQVALGRLGGRHPVRRYNRGHVLQRPNVPLLREHYEGLPHRLEKEHIDPHIPWLYGFKLDFRFR